VVSGSGEWLWREKTLASSVFISRRDRRDAEKTENRNLAPGTSVMSIVSVSRRNRCGAEKAENGKLRPQHLCDSHRVRFTQGPQGCRESREGNCAGIGQQFKGRMNKDFRYCFLDYLWKLRL